MKKHNWIAVFLVSACVGLGQISVFASENVTKIQSAVQEKFNKVEEEIVEEENHE